MPIGNWGSRFANTIRRWVRYYIGFSKGAIFITGLIFSHALVDYALVSVLMSYIKDQFEVSSSKAAAVVNMKEYVTYAIAIVSAHISDAYLGRFMMVLFTTVAYISGLVVLCFSGSNVPVSYMALLLIGLGEAGREPPLQEFLADQFNTKQDNNNEEQVESRRKTWWGSFWLGGILVAAFVLPNSSWHFIVKTSALLMGATYVIFLCGYSFYTSNEPTGSPLTLVFRVFVAATLKRHWRIPDDLNELHELPENSSRENYVGDRVARTRWWLRWLYKAAIREEQVNGGRLFRVTQVREATLLLEMIPMWTTFLVYGLVKSTGSTFFIEQADNDYVNDSIGSIQVGATFLILIQSISSFGIYFMSELLLSKILTESQRRYAILVRIGVGMLFSVLCCITAWHVEARRLQAGVRISILWLAPQFCLLGVMERFAENGLSDFFNDRVPGSMENYGPPFNNCVIGIGSLLSILSVHLFKGLLGEDLNESHLDKYYLKIIIFSSINLLVFVIISSRYQYKNVPEGGEVIPAAEIPEEPEVPERGEVIPAAEVPEVFEGEVTVVVEGEVA